MERQIGANGVIMQKSSCKYIHHNSVKEFRTFWLHSNHLQRLKLYIEIKLIFLYCECSYQKLDCHASIFAEKRRFIFKCEEM